MCFFNIKCSIYVSSFNIFRNQLAEIKGGWQSQPIETKRAFNWEKIDNESIEMSQHHISFGGKLLIYRIKYNLGCSW